MHLSEQSDIPSWLSSNSGVDVCGKKENISNFLKWTVVFVSPDHKMETPPKIRM